MFNRLSRLAILIGALAVAAPGWAKEEPSSNAALAKEIARLSAAVDAMAKPAPADHGCPDRKDIRGSDLCAQWTAADAAREAAAWAMPSFIITLLGTIGLVGTIIQGKFALARARESNELARQGIHADNRAWLDVTVQVDGDFEWDETGCRLALKYEVVNHGTSPAMNAGIMTKIAEIREMDAEYDRFIAMLKEDGPHVILGNIFPGERREQSVIMQFDLDDPEKNNASLTALIGVNYRTIFDTQHDPHRFTAQVFNISHMRDGALYVMDRKHCPIPPYRIAMSRHIGGYSLAS